MRIPSVLLFLIFLLMSPSHGQVVINEIMASNATTISDEDGDYEDWIELYNPSDEPLPLKWFGLSDDYDNPFRWVIPDTTINPGEFLLIWASGKDRSLPGAPLHTNFSISQAGEEVILTHFDGRLLDEHPPREIPTDISYGRYPDGSDNWYYFKEPTPGESNQEQGFEAILEPPRFSLSPGFYPQDSVTVALLHDHPDATIYFTVDGSVPDTTSTRYTEPLHLFCRGDEPNQHAMIRTTPPEGDERGYGWSAPEIKLDKAHTLRAFAVLPGKMDSPVLSGTWFPEMEQKSLPVLSIVGPEKSFFDFNDGIYVPGALYELHGFGRDNWGRPHANYFQRGYEWEREVSFEWFELNNLLFQQNIGVRIHGSGSRALPQKSLRLYARSRYGQSHFFHPVFENYPYSAFKRLILRNSGQDFYQRATMLRDGFMQKLISGLQVQTQAFRPSVLYLNGEYWGIHNIRERYDKYFFERVYNVSEQFLDYLESIGVPKEGNNDHYLEMITFIEENELENQEHFEHLATMMDMDNFIDYFILNIFLRNSDWPGNNIDFWRYNGPADPLIPEKDGRWRWLVFDLDFGFALNQGQGAWEFDMIDHVTRTEQTTYANHPESTFLIRSLLKNEGFRHRFINRFCDLLNSTFQTNHMVSLLDEMAGSIEHEIERHIRRWSHPSSITVWENNLNLMRTFAEKRPDIQHLHLQNHFDTGEPAKISVKIEEMANGIVKLNTLKIGTKENPIHPTDNGYLWSGIYYSGIPIELEAIAAEGHTFSHWKGIANADSLNPEITIVPNDDLLLEAVFTPTEEELFPQPFVLADSTYRFRAWPEDAPAGTFPPNMAFVYMDTPEPFLDAQIDGFVSGAYDLEDRTRINGLGDDGFSFLNTANLDGNPGYPGRRLGGALLALDTRNIESAEVEWRAGTRLPNSREYALRLQYRIGSFGDFTDMKYPDGTPVEYIRNEDAGHQADIYPVMLPDTLLGHANVQLFWRYYHTGMRYDEESGARSKLNISSITVQESKDVFADKPETESLIPEIVSLKQNYPNPFNSSTRISYELPEESKVNLSVYDITGRKIATLVDGSIKAGTHTVAFDARHLASGLYLCRLVAGESTEVIKMTLIR